MVGTLVNRFETFIGSAFGMVPSSGERPAGGSKNKYSYPTATGEIQVTEEIHDNAFFEQQVASARATGRMESPKVLKDAIEEFYGDLENEREAERRIPRISDDEDEELG